MSLDLAFNIALSLLSALGGLWLKSVSEELRRLQYELTQVRQDYQRREDAQRDLQLMTGMMQDIKDSIQRIDNKLDRKADK
ncbi:MAG: hypothetical protein EKE20_15055 [Candidatus Symbiopectobacterium sp. Dall1.0]|uniref:hypothetical protein n=1 Tax=Sodalis praecaptivus TaxID=1239307 RepID=UPI0009212D79|nr:hypothetical protein [Candidatus Symbiopectobacterium sp. Dall1.0]OIV46730.1 hypothetical protein BK025_09300 [Sodalis sp. TME1]